ncbi:MAG: hypothetical protein H6721_22185 [Sandaracinus sp.]|nr:hypothetical protein [Myxococcales bacterium]MCB9634844.1 hypothetical protein [Sandaracinus sp.]
MRLASCLLFVLACTPPVEGALRDARSATDLPPDLEVRWEERGGTSTGARDLVVRGDGTFEHRTWRPGFAAGDPTSRGTPGGRPDAEGRHTVSAEQVRDLIALVLEIEGWDQEVDDDLPDPALDQGRAWLKLRVGGAESEVWEHHADLEATGRLVRVRSALEAMLATAHAHALDPETAGEEVPADDGDEENDVAREAGPTTVLRGDAEGVGVTTP